MRAQVEARLVHLEQAQQQLQQDLAALEQQRQGLLQQLLAVQGGITVLHELLAEEPSDASWEPVAP